MPAQALSHPPPAPPIQQLWLPLADGLQVQRVHLHLPEWRDVVAVGGPLPDAPEVGYAGVLAARPMAPDPSVVALADSAAYGFWLDLPAEHGLAAGPANALAPATLGVGRTVIGDAPPVRWGELVRCAVDAAAWWVGFFAIIRHRGVHHVTLEQAKPEVTLATLSDAAETVALGAAIRVLETHLRHAEAGDEAARAAYCRALAASVESERRMPALLEELAELRLVDLVSASIPWRARFAKYAGGTGAGQVE